MVDVLIMNLNHSPHEDVVGAYYLLGAIEVDGGRGQI